MYLPNYIMYKFQGHVGNAFLSAYQTLNQRMTKQFFHVFRLSAVIYGSNEIPYTNR